MKNNFLIICAFLFLAWFLPGCDSSNQNSNNDQTADTIVVPELSMHERVAEYAQVKLTTDLVKLNEKQKDIIRILIEVSDIMDDIYWD
ncbi:MAG: hypothetical protein ABIJ16_06750, partial [Bacteroidota bacterium]